jgi:hypothetical protein
MKFKPRLPLNDLNVLNINATFSNDISMINYIKKQTFIAIPTKREITMMCSKNMVNLLFPPLLMFMMFVGHQP